MTVTANTVKFLPIWHRLPDISTMPTVEKPSRISSPEVMNPLTLPTAAAIKAKLLQAVGQNGVGGIELFAQMALSTVTVQALPDTWIYAYYLNARFGRPMPETMIPIRAGSVYSENVYLLAPLMICSAILMYEWDLTRDTINPTIKIENNWLMRTLTQINYVIYKIIQANPNAIPSGNLVVSAITAYDENGEEHIAWLDVDRLVAWEAAGRTPQQAADWWFEHRTQPALN